MYIHISEQHHTWRLEPNPATHLCMYVFIYLHISICMYMSIYINIYFYIYTYMHISAKLKFRQACTRVHGYISSCKHVQVAITREMN